MHRAKKASQPKKPAPAKAPAKTTAKPARKTRPLAVVPKPALEPTPAPASPFAAKMIYLRELVGNEAALEEALKRGSMRVSLPGAARTRRARRDPSERPKTRKVFAPELVTQIRTLRSAGHSYAQCEVLAGLQPDKGRTAWRIVNAYEPEAE